VPATLKLLDKPSIHHATLGAMVYEVGWVVTGSAIVNVANVEATKPSFQFGIMVLSDDFSHSFFLTKANPKTVSLMQKSKIPMKWSVRLRLLLSILVAGLISLMLPAWLHLPTRLLCIWDSGALCFLIFTWTWTVMFRVTPDICDWDDQSSFGRASRFSKNEATDSFA
jgi:hypothetical protein